ncbi:MAG: ATP-binding protein [Candidatus Micrarchaeota archaeon]
MIDINEKIRRLLLIYNPFWKSPLELKYKERRIYREIKDRLLDKQVISLCGLRRVGKTMILRKIISELISGHGADSVLYFSFDDFSQLELYEIIDEFESIHGHPPRFLVFDEVQKLANWAEKVKILYDAGKYKIFVSGSDSLFLRKGSRESLAGRILEYEVARLSFSEYLDFVEKGQLAKKPLLYQKELEKEFEKYLFTAGFPELVGDTRADFVRQYIQTAILEKILFIDMPRIYPIDDPQQLKSILEILADRPGMIVDVTSFSRELGISRQTLSKYLGCLEMAHLVIKLYNYSRNKSTSEKRLKKYYPNFLSPALLEGKDGAYYAQLVESCCAINTKAGFFWRDKYKNEVDLVLQERGETIPVEVKFSRSHIDAPGISKFAAKFKCKQGYVLTRDMHKMGKSGLEIEWLPVFEFLLKY